MLSSADDSEDHKTTTHAVHPRSQVHNSNSQSQAATTRTYDMEGARGITLRVPFFYPPSTLKQQAARLVGAGQQALPSSYGVPAAGDSRKETY